MRRFRRVVVLGLALGCVVLAQINRTAAGEPGKQEPRELDRAVKVKMKYLLYLPKDYDAKQSFPLLLFLHGAGERGDDLNALKVYGPPKMIESGQDLPFIVVSPVCPVGKTFETLTSDLTVLLDEIVEKYKVDQDRIYATGLSMGGFGTWALAVSTPNRFAAIAPICGGGDPRSARRIAHVPAWVFHGAKDTTVPLERSEKMVEALKQSGGNVRFTVYPNTGHNSWIEAYADPELYEWLLQQKRTPKKPEGAK
jgi:predicted peptidase